MPVSLIGYVKGLNGLWTLPLNPKRNRRLNPDRMTFGEVQRCIKNFMV